EAFYGVFQNVDLFNILEHAFDQPFIAAAKYFFCDLVEHVAWDLSGPELETAACREAAQFFSAGHKTGMIPQKRLFYC
ncbi:hypothetical protein, partial [Thiolapillus sp.]|uniref:hypothetical protein n=1 Tax=Thiolapillus sp. TaxID=2017437 RepID=UPI0025D30A7E